MAKLLFEIVTAERLVSSQEVDVVVAPGVEGELAVLPHHAPLLTSLRPGEVLVRNDGEETYIAVSGGFLEVMPDKVTILADAAERAEEIDEQRAEEAFRRAQERIKSAPADVDLDRELASMRFSQARLASRAGAGGVARPRGGIAQDTTISLHGPSTPRLCSHRTALPSKSDRKLGALAILALPYFSKGKRCRRSPVTR